MIANSRWMMMITVGSTVGLLLAASAVLVLAQAQMQSDPAQPGMAQRLEIALRR
jgi:hypothetical protein